MTKSPEKRNFETLKKAGLIPEGNTLTDEDKAVLESLSEEEVKALISAKAKLGDDFLHKNIRDAPNVYL